MSSGSPWTPKWEMMLTFPESSETAAPGYTQTLSGVLPPAPTAEALQKTFCTVLIQVGESPAPLGVVGFDQDEKTVLVRLNPQHAGVRSAALTRDQEQMKDFAAVVWANAAEGWRKERGDWPWPSAHDCWPGFVEMGWIAGERIQTLLGPVQ